MPTFGGDSILNSIRPNINDYKNIPLIHVRFLSVIVEDYYNKSCNRDKSNFRWGFSSYII